MVSEDQKSCFDRICCNIITGDRMRSQIGELSEKTVHSVLKNYFEPNPCFQEVKIGRYYADICRGNEIIEIQTANFNRLREKLAAFLPDYQVTVVYPIPHIKYMIWVDENTGELSDRRKSPKKGSYYQVFPELYKIKPFLKNPGLKLCLVLFDTEEYRLLNGWSKNRKRGSSRFDRLPLGLHDQITLETTWDYLQFVPFELEQFTSEEYARTIHVPKHQAGVILNILNELNVVQRIGKKGNAYIYQAIEPG